MRPNMNESLTPVPVEEVFAGLCDKTDAAWQLGHELMQPMPPFWFRTMHETTAGDWQVVVVDHNNYYMKPWPERENYGASGDAPSLIEAHKIAREQAWAKHRKNMEEKQ